MQRCNVKGGAAACNRTRHGKVARDAGDGGVRDDGRGRGKGRMAKVADLALPKSHGVCVGDSFGIPVGVGVCGNRTRKVHSLDESYSD